MDLFVVSSGYTKIDHIDDYESVIWTERYNDKGEFQITAKPRSKAAQLLTVDTLFIHDDSDKVMMVDEVLDGVDDLGISLYTISGKSLEHVVLANRSVGANYKGPNMVVTGTPGFVAARIVEKICVSGEDIYELDAIPELTSVDNSGGTKRTRHEIKPQSLFTAVKDICDSDDLGFQIVRYVNPNSPSSNAAIRFEVYKGVKRPYVIFSSDLDTLTRESHLQSKANYYNAAYVWAKGGLVRRTVYAKGITSAHRGLQRRILTVTADDVDPAELTQAEYEDALDQRGREALAEKPKVDIFDGELTPYAKTKYRQDYFLGDTVTLINARGDKFEHVVTEYIWSQDSAGAKAYPTFMAKEA